MKLLDNLHYQVTYCKLVKGIRVLKWNRSEAANFVLNNATLNNLQELKPLYFAYLKIIKIIILSIFFTVILLCSLFVIYH